MFSKLRRFKLAIAILTAVALALVFFVFQPARAAGPWYVAPGGNDGHTCLSPAEPCATINGAIGKASSGDTIYVATGTYISSTGSEVVLIDKSVTLSGGWDTAFLSQSNISTIDGQNARRGITINKGVTVIVEQFFIQNGLAPSVQYYGSRVGGGIYNLGMLEIRNTTVMSNVASIAGGIHNTGILTLTNSAVTNNSVDNSGGGIYNSSYQATGIIFLNNSVISNNTANVPLFGSGSGFGGGIATDGGTVILNNSAVTGNRATPKGGGGGGIYSSSTLILNNSTVSGNIITASPGTASSGAGIYVEAGTVDVNNCTITANASYATTSPWGGGVFGGQGGGIYRFINNVPVITLRNTILAGNTASAGPDCSGTVNTAGYNLVGDISGCTFTPGSGDQIGVGPRLGPLEDNGGPTPTHALALDSPAINAGDPGGCMGSPGLLTTDQRGYSRVGRCDIGAVELQELETSTKTVNVPTASKGEPIAYTILLRNTSGAPVNNILITDPLPLTLTYNPNSLNAPSGTYGYSTGVITWTGSVNSGETVMVAFGATVNQTALWGSSIVNSASIDGGGEIFTRAANIDVLAEIFLPFIKSSCPVGICSASR